MQRNSAEPPLGGALFEDDGGDVLTVESNSEPESQPEAESEPSREAAPRALTPTEMGAWRGFLRAHAMIIRQLEAELEAEQSMALASYDVLVQLAEAPGYALRMSDLAESVLLSRSGLTRLVDRLEREGLVERRASPDDARGTLAVLTPKGMDRLRVAWVTHLRGVREHMISRLNDAELATLSELFSRLATPQGDVPS
jgi:DNA-binding MarR family transcriptional regulator